MGKEKRGYEPYHDAVEYSQKMIGHSNKPADLRSMPKPLQWFFNIVVAFVAFLFFFLSACSPSGINDGPSNSIIFQSEGNRWEAIIENDVIERNGKKYFKILYRYKGDVEDLRDVERITFAQGTALGTQVRNLYDPTYQQKLANQGGYQEEYEEQYGIIIDEIKNRHSKDFMIEYDLLEADLEYTTFDEVLKDGIMIIIHWETRDYEYKDRITGSGLLQDGLTS